MKCPNGLYVAARYTKRSVERLEQLINALAIPNPIPIDEIHTTVMYSETPVDDFTDIPKDGKKVDQRWRSAPLAFEVFESSEGKKCLVLLLFAPYLHLLHMTLKADYNLQYSYDTYKPHITLSYDCPTAEEFLKVDPYMYLPFDEGDGELEVDLVFANDRDDDWESKLDDDEEEATA